VAIYCIGKKEHQKLSGLNVLRFLIKRRVLPYFGRIDEEAKAIGAVNAIQLTKSGFKRLQYGCNELVSRNSIKLFLEKHTHQSI